MTEVAKRAQICGGETGLRVCCGHKKIPQMEQPREILRKWTVKIMREKSTRERQVLVVFEKEPPIHGNVNEDMAVHKQNLSVIVIYEHICVELRITSSKDYSPY